MLCVPSFQYNLLSVNKITKDLNCSVSFFSTCCVFQDLLSGKVKGIDEVENGFYVFNWKDNQSVKGPKTVSVAARTADPMLWHKRLGHVPMGVIRRIKEFNQCGTFVIDKCTICPQPRQTRVPFPLSTTKADTVFDLIHMDVWGPYKVFTYNGMRYFLTLVDDKSRWIWIFLLALKSDVIVAIKQFLLMVKTQFGKCVKVFRSDNGGEFLNTNCHDLFVLNGIVHQRSRPHTPQQNRVVERKHRHLLETARALKIQSSLPSRYWEDCVETAAYIFNRMPLSVLGNKSPYKELYDKSPSMSHFKVMGCFAFATNLLTTDKFASRVRKAVLLGYAVHQKGYKLLEIESRVIFVSRDVTFFEDMFPFKSQNLNTGNTLQFLVPQVVAYEPYTCSDDSPTTTGIDPPPVFAGDEVVPSSLPTESSPADGAHDYSVGIDHIHPEAAEADDNEVQGNLESDLVQKHTTNVADSPPVIARKSTRRVKPPIWHTDYVMPQKKAVGSCLYSISNVLDYESISPSYKSFVIRFSQEREPSHYHDAVKDVRWVEAMKNEIQALEDNHTWIITQLPKDKKAIGCRWVYKIKYKADGEVDRFKARLVAKGYNQKEGLDYQETFSPVVKMVTVRVVISLAAAQGWSIHQMDVYNAFLQGDLNEEVYMDLPLGFNHLGGKGVVCKLTKSFYGLKQASRQWNIKLTTALLTSGFQQSHFDYSLFTRHQGRSIVVVLVYVDDLLIIGNDHVLILEMKKILKDSFKIKDLGDLRYFLGIEFARNDTGIIMHQRKY